MANEVDYNPCEYNGNGQTTDFSFNWKLIKPEELLVELENISTGKTTTLQRGTDYNVNQNEVGGNVVFTTAPTADYNVILSRKTSNYQSTGYSTSPGFQGSEIEKSFDKVSCLLQEQDYNIETFKNSFSSETNEKIDNNKADTDKQISTNKSDTDKQIEEFEAEINGKLTQVNNAVEKLNRLDEVLEECENYSNTAEEQSIVATQQATEANNSATSAEKALSEIQQEHEGIVSDAAKLREQTINDVEATKANAETEIKSLGIFMEDDRLFYYDKSGVKHEFRNDFGGIAPMPVKHKEVEKTENGYLLTWADPDDSVYENNVYCKWGNTLILRKEGSYPESPFDGEIVLNNTIRNQYAKTGYLDEVDTTKEYYYRAFPRSINRVYSQDDFNKFGLWVYSFTRLMNETIPSKKIVYRGINEHYNNAYNNFAAGNKVELGDWENAPFLLKDRLAPCAVNFAGELKFFLDVNDYTKKEDGTASNNADPKTDLNFYMRIKLLYRRKRTNANGDTEIDISNIKVNDEYKPYGGFVKPDGTLREYIYLPIYRGSLIDNKVRSIAGQTPMSGQTAPNERKYCQNNGAGHDMITHSDRELIEDIYMLMFKNTDSQSALGQGKSDGGNSVAYCLVSGTMDKKGLFSGSQSTSEGIKFLGMENRWGSQWERILGEVLVNGLRKVKLCQGTSDGSTVEDYNFTGEGYIPLAELPTITGTNGGYISKEQTVDDIGTFPVVISGSSSTNECDGMWFDNSGTMVAFRGGASNGGAICGVFCSTLDNPASTARWNIGSSVSYKPL